jgi:hypothetical protein
MFIGPVEVLGSGKDSGTRSPKRIKGNDVRVADGWHCVEGKRGLVIGKGLTASTQPTLSTTSHVMQMTPLGPPSIHQAPMACQLANHQVINNT